MADSPEIFVQPEARVKYSGAWRVVVPVAALVVGVAFTGNALAAAAPAAPNTPAAHAVAAPAPHVAATAKATPPHTFGPAKPAPVATAPKVAPHTFGPAKPAPVAAAPVAAAPGVRPAVKTGPATPTVRAASVAGSTAPVVTAVPQNGTTTLANPPHLDDHLTYQYNALGRRDPFQSLVDGAFVGADVGGDAPPDPGGIKVVGIVWGANDQFALVEDVRGNSFVLRKGDKVQNGVVEGLKRDGVIVNITAEGQSQSVVIPLVRKGDSNAR